EFGQVKEYGDMNKVIPNYEAFLSKWEKMSENERTNYKQAALNQEDNISNIDVDKFFTPNPDYNKVIEKPISKLAHFRGGNYNLVSYPNVKKKNLNKYLKRDVYYVKNKAI